MRSTGIPTAAQRTIRETRRAVALEGRSFWRSPATAVIAVVAAPFLLGARAQAHDFWIEPSSHRPAPGTAVGVTLRVGSRDDSVTYPRNPAHLERFVLAREDMAIPVAGETGDDPAGRIVVPSPGPWWLGYRSQVTLVALDARKFEDYLRDEGLENALETRAELAETGRPTVEMFSRFAKALLWAGVPTDDLRARSAITTPLGFTLELVPEQDPSAIRPERELPVRLLFNGAPLAGALVDATRMAAPGHAIARRTDASGRVSLPLAHAGVWMLAAVHMQRVTGPARATWESWWASLTFELGEGRRSR